MDYGLLAPFVDALAASRASPLWPLSGVSAALASQLGPLLSAVTLAGALAALAGKTGTRSGQDGHDEYWVGPTE